MKKILIEPGWKNVLSACLGILVGMLMVFSVWGYDKSIQWDVIKSQAQLQNIAIGALLVSSFVVLFTVIVSFLFVRLYYKVSILEKKFDQQNTDGGSMQIDSKISTKESGDVHMPTKYLGMFFLGFSQIIILICTAKLFPFLLTGFDILSEISTRKTSILLQMLNMSLISLAGLSILFLLLLKSSFIIKRIEK